MIVLKKIQEIYQSCKQNKYPQILGCDDIIVCLSHAIDIQKNVNQIILFMYDMLHTGLQGRQII